MVNVPTAVLIDENGIIVRHDEDAYSRSYSAGSLAFGNDRYRPAVIDWLEKGAESRYALTPEEVTAPLRGTTDNAALADASFKLGVWFHLGGNAERAELHWRRAQELNPDSWNYHRQDWSFLADPSETNRNWFQKYQSLGDKPYYRPLELPSADGP